ncbi:MAG: hypothetical protein V1760_00365, partial [Candidatus Peregrinibacteria bacterium]
AEEKEKAQKKIAELEAFRDADGSYRLWGTPAESTGNHLETAYILFVLNEAKKAGLTIPPLEETIRALWNTLGNDGENLTAEEQIFLLWALSEVGQYDTRLTLNAFKSRDASPLYSRGLMLLNLYNLIEAGQKSVQPFLERLKSELADQLIQEGSKSYFAEEGQVQYGSSSERTTGVLLLALSRTSPGNPILRPLVNHLIDKEAVANTYPLDTQSLAWKLLGLREYQEQNTPVVSQYGFKGMLDSHSFQGAVDTDNLNEVFIKEGALENLDKKDNIALSLEKDGIGPLYFKTDLAYLSRDELPAQSNGLVITRQYGLLPKTSFANELKQGEIYQGKLQLIVPKDLSYVVVKEQLPAGMQALTFSSDLMDTLTAYREQEENSRQGYTWHTNPLWHFDHHEIQEDGLLLFSSYLPAGVYTIDFLAEAVRPGRFQHLPAYAYQLFNPSVFGRTEGRTVEIK